jgi:hypothetical protein
MKPLSRLRSRRAFLLLECMLAVFIFGMASLGLGRCVQNCLRAEQFRREEALAERALSNYWVQIVLGAYPIAQDKVTDPLHGNWEGMTLVVTREALQLKNENDQDIFGIYHLSLSITWGAGANEQVRTVEFITYPRNQ